MAYSQPRRNPSLPAQDGHFEDKLFEAAENGAIQLIEAQLASNSRDIVHIRNNRGQTLLHIAAGYGRSSVVRLLLKHGAEVNQNDHYDMAPLHNSCGHGHFKVSKMLIQAGAIVDARDSKGLTPLHWAVYRLIDRKSKQDCYRAVIELLIASGADPLIKSIRSGQNCFDRLEDESEKRGVKLMYFASKLETMKDQMTIDSEESRTNLVDSLFTVEDFFELIRLDEERIKFMMTPRLINSRLKSLNNITPLHRAAGHNRLEIAKQLIEMGAKVNAIDELGRIPIHNAAQYNHVDMIVLLINSGSEISKQDLDGHSPLHVAAACNETSEACVRLLELGANDRLRSRENKTPYDLAETEEVKEALRRQKAQEVPSTSPQAVYVAFESATDTTQSQLYYLSSVQELNGLSMLDSDSDKRLFDNTGFPMKKYILSENNEDYKKIKDLMLGSIVFHLGENGGRYRSFDISKVERIYNEKVWYKYRAECGKFKREGVPKNERLLFHGSAQIDEIVTKGFDERFANERGMFGSGIYFAEHSSKSNQYVFGFGSGCRPHNNKSCYICDRKMILAQVALGKSLIAKRAILEFPHGPPGYDSVTGKPGTTESLDYPEYAIYKGDRAYPLFVITYKLVPPESIPMD